MCKKMNPSFLCEDGIETAVSPRPPFVITRLVMSWIPLSHHHTPGIFLNSQWSARAQTPGITKAFAVRTNIVGKGLSFRPKLDNHQLHVFDFGFTHVRDILFIYLYNISWGWHI